MKKLNQVPGRAAAAALVSLLALRGALPARGQVFYTTTVLTNGAGVMTTNSAPVLSQFNLVTNFASSYLQARSLMVTNVNTNATYILNYGYQPPGAATTNLWIAGTIATNFPASNGWVNGSTWVFPVPAFNFSAPVIPWGQIIISNGAAWTNGVVWQ